MRVHIEPLDRYRDWGYVKKYASAIACEDTCGIVAIDLDTGKQLAAAVFDMFTPNSAQTHIVMTNPIVLRHKFLESAAEFVFIHAKRNVIYGLVPADNVKAVKFDKHIGFVEQIRLKDGFKKGVDYIIFEMRKENCRWLTQQHRAAA